MAIVPTPRLTLRLSTTRTGIDVGDVARGELGALHRGREAAGQRHDDDAGGTLVAQLAVDGFELAGRRRRRLRQRAAARAPPPELSGRQLLAIEELLVTEPDRERHDADPVLLARPRREGRTTSRSRSGSWRSPVTPAGARPLACPQMIHVAGGYWSIASAETVAGCRLTLSATRCDVTLAAAALEVREPPRRRARAADRPSRRARDR